MRTFRTMAPIAWRNLWRRRSRTALTMTAVAIAVTALIVFGSFMRAWSDSAFDRTVAALTGHGQIHARGFLEDPTVDRRMPEPAAALTRVLDGPEVAAWAPRVVAPALIRSERESAPVQLYGIDPAREAEVSFLKPGSVEGRDLEGGDADGVIMGRLLADRLQIDLGRRVVISAQDAKGDISEMGVRLIGFYEGQPDLQRYVVFVSLGRAQTLLGMGHGISEIAFLAPQREGIDRAIAAVKNAAPELDVQRWDELQPFARAVIDLADGTNVIWLFVSFALVAFGLINTLLLTVYERMREFGLMQAVGTKPRQLLAQVLLESVYLVTLGTIGGAAMGSGIVYALRGGIHLGALGAGAEMFGAAQTIYPVLRPVAVVVACAVVVVLAIPASLYPAFQATRRVPVEVLTRAQT